jgi:hypothetical protein
MYTKQPATVLRAAKCGKSSDQDFQVPGNHLANLEVEDVHDYIRCAIQQNDVSTNQYVGAIRRRWRQPPFEVFGAGLQSLLKPWRERATSNELFFQSRWQLISLRQARRKMALVLAIPPAHSFAVMVFVIVFTLVVVIVMLIVAFSMSLSVILGLRSSALVSKRHSPVTCAGRFVWRCNRRGSHRRKMLAEIAPTK